MRTVNRNKRPIAYASYLGVQEIVDDDGNYTGEYSVQYSTPIKSLMNVSGGKGQSNISLFGLTDNFSKTVVTDDLETDFNTSMVFWIETDPDTELFDYRVVLVSRTINQVVIALAEVDSPCQEIQSV